jgi:hypothetical protein
VEPSATIEDMEKSQLIDFESPTANMEGCEPCPRCKDEHRAPVNDASSYTNIVIKCGVCRHQEVGASVEGRRLWGEIKKEDSER